MKDNAILLQRALVWYGQLPNYQTLAIVMVSLTGIGIWKIYICCKQFSTVFLVTQWYSYLQGYSLYLFFFIRWNFLYILSNPGRCDLKFHQNSGRTCSICHYRRWVATILRCNELGINSDRPLVVEEVRRAKKVSRDGSNCTRLAQMRQICVFLRIVFSAF